MKEWISQNMRKIYVVMAMRDMFEDEIARRQEKLLELAGEFLHEPVMLIETYIRNEKYNALECLGECIKRMAKADYVLFADGWENSRRSKIEMACALEYNKNILLEQNNKIEEVV